MKLTQLLSIALAAVSAVNAAPTSKVEFDSTNNQAGWGRRDY